MVVLHFDSDHPESRAFRADRLDAEEGILIPLVGDALLAAVREVVWYEEEVWLLSDSASRAQVSASNLLMFLSDVRARKFRQGVFLGESVLEAARVFRAAAECAAKGRYVPELLERGGQFFAHWRAIGKKEGNADFFAFCLDALVRRAQRTLLEEDPGRHYTVHDAWLAALRSDSGVVAWNDADDLRELASALDAWSSPLAVSPTDCAALHFHLCAPRAEKGVWKLRLESAPTTRMGVIALGQAAKVCPQLRALSHGVVELDHEGVESFLRTGARALSAAGYAVDMPAGVIGEHVTAEAELDPGGGRPVATEGAGETRSGASIGAKLKIHVDGEVVTEQEIEFLLQQGSSLVFFRDRWITVDRYVLREALHALQSVKSRRLDVRQAVAFALGTGRAGRLRIEKVKAHGWLRGLLNELRGKDRFALLPAPKGFCGELRDYQLRGYSWLSFLARWGFGPCLADDMGLGKTVQTIAWTLQHLAQLPKGERAPVLVVAPVSVGTNWLREFQRFAPSLRVALHQGANRAMGTTFRRMCLVHDVVVTGYSLLVRDWDDFSCARFSALVLDEAQNIKNPDAKVSRAARSLETPVKIALTGTPFENSANDLWSIEECLNPGLLGERKTFEEEFTRSIRENAHGGAVGKLRRVLEPFLLRRLKTEKAIAAELGEKREVREYCPLSAVQRSEYETALDGFRRDSAAGESSRGRILALLTELKLICDGEGKLLRLDELLAEIFASGESCLVFTQYAKVGRMLREHLQEEFGRSFPFLHGSLSPTQRDAEIAAFNESSEPSAFILSLRAGGFGLNLTKATHVIHFDRWWNPAVESQATDRAHRIGQRKTVFVHTFICAGTLEEHIDELLESKRRIAGEIVASGESFLLSMDPRSLDKLLSLD